MNASFPDWYRSAAVTVPEGRLETRWAGVQSVIDKSDSQMIASLATQFVLPGREILVTPGLRDAFRAHDDSFPLKNNLEELRVLSGAILGEIICQKKRLALLASLALTCGSFGQRRIAVPVQDHLDTARAFIDETSKLMREGDGLAAPKAAVDATEQLGKTFPETFFAAGQTPLLRTPLVQALSESNAAIRELQRYSVALSHRVLVREEELNFLWWLQTQTSRDLKRSFSEVGQVAGCAIFPSELADLTRLLPGPGSIAAILLRGLLIAGASSSSDTVSLRDVVNATPREWRERLIGQRVLSSIELLCPVHLAIAKSLVTDGVDDWLPVYQKACDIDARNTSPLSDLTMQAYQERMLEACVMESKP